MNKVSLLYFLLICILLLFTLFNWIKQEVIAKEEYNPGNYLEITITYDNYPFMPGLHTSWGFSCVIRGL